MSTQTGNGASALKIGGLFEGYGGLTMGTRSVLGGELSWYSEHEPATGKTPRPTQAAARLLAHRNPGVPNLGDIATVDWSRVASVDVLTAGFPCQDVSSAGKRVGMYPGTRSGLWAHTAYAIAQLRPRLVVIENVRGLFSAKAYRSVESDEAPLGDGHAEPVLRAFGAVLGDLSELGYDARWCGLRAADVGAPHGRYRVFVTARPAAYTKGRGEAAAQLSGFPHGALSAGDGTSADADSIGPPRPGEAREWWCGDPHHHQPPADTLGEGCGPWGRVGRPTGTPVERDHPPTAADAQGSAWRGTQPEHLAAATGRATEPGERAGAAAWGDYTPAIRRWELILGRSAPAPTQPGKRGGQQLSPLFVEWLMGLPEGHVTAVPGLSRNEQLKLLGNGVVPQQAAAALSWLLGVASERGEAA